MKAEMEALKAGEQAPAQEKQAKTNNLSKVPKASSQGAPIQSKKGVEDFDFKSGNIRDLSRFLKRKHHLG